MIRNINVLEDISETSESITNPFDNLVSSHLSGGTRNYLECHGHNQYL